MCDLEQGTRATLWPRDTWRCAIMSSDNDNNVQCARRTQIDFRFLTLSPGKGETPHWVLAKPFVAVAFFTACLGTIAALLSRFVYPLYSIVFYSSVPTFLDLVLVLGRFFKPFRSALNSFWQTLRTNVVNVPVFYAQFVEFTRSSSAFLPISVFCSVFYQWVKQNILRSLRGIRSLLISIVFQFCFLERKGLKNQSALS